MQNNELVKVLDWVKTNYPEAFEFMYFCFWVFISSCFVRWVVGLKTRKETDYWVNKYGMTYNKYIQLPNDVIYEINAKILDDEWERLTNKKTHS